MVSSDTAPRPPIEDLEEELAAALPDTQGPRFFPMLRRLAYHLIAFILLGAAAFVLWRAFRDIRPADVAAAIADWGWGVVAAALSLSALSFLLMGFVEWMGLRWAGAKIGVRSALAGSFIASAMAHSLGANLLVSGAVRARFYGRRGVTLRQVAATTLFQSFSFTVGIATLAGLCMLLAGSEEIATAIRIPNPVADIVGIALLAGVGGYVVLCATLRRPLRGFGHSVRLPSVRVALAQLAVDNAVAAAIIWILLPTGAVGYLAFVTAYAPSVIAGLISHVPGGVGVFEGSMSALVKGVAPAPLAAAFLGYRLFFFLIPLSVAGLALVADSLRARLRAKA